MRVVFVNRFFWPDHSATSQLLCDLAAHLASRGISVTVVTSRQRYDNAKAALPLREKVDGIRVIRVRSTRFGRTRLLGRALDYVTFFASAFVYVLRYARTGDVVVSKTDPPLLSVLAAVVACVRRIRRVNWLQDVFPEAAQAAGLRVAHGTLGLLSQSVRDWSLKGATNVVLSESMANVVRMRCAVITEVIPNWADGNAIKPVESEANPLRREWGLSQSFVAAYSGNMGRVHEFRTVLAAAKRLRREAGIRFLFIGDGHLRAWVEQEVHRDQLDSVTLKPYQDKERLSLSLGVGDVHFVSLQPSMEGLVVPSKFYGIAAAARPVIYVGDVHGEIPRLLARHEIGIAVQPGDVDTLVAALLDLKKDPQRRRAMGARARAVFEAEYDKPIALARWEAALRAAAH